MRNLYLGLLGARACGGAGAKPRGQPLHVSSRAAATSCHRLGITGSMCLIVVAGAGVLGRARLAVYFKRQACRLLYFSLWICWSLAGDVRIKFVVCTCFCRPRVSRFGVTLDRLDSLADCSRMSASLGAIRRAAWCLYEEENESRRPLRLSCCQAEISSLC